MKATILKEKEIYPYAGTETRDCLRCQVNISYTDQVICQLRVMCSIKNCFIPVENLEKYRPLMTINSNEQYPKIK